MQKQKSKRRRIMLAAVLIALFTGMTAFLIYLFQYSGMGTASVVYDNHAGDAHYTMEITPYYSEGAMLITQTVDFTNSGTALDRIVFALPVNAYRRSSTVPMDSDEFDASFTDSYMPGGIEFNSIAVNGNKVEWGVSGSGEAVLTLMCDIAPYESVSVYMEYHVLLPGFAGAGGFDDTEWRMTDFYPHLCSLTDGEWTAYSPGYVGRYECFQVSDYSVILHAHSDYDVVACGNTEYASDIDGWRTWSIEAYDLRNLSIVMRQGGCIYEQNVDGICLRVYGDSRLTSRHMVSIAAKIVSQMNTLYPYPYSTLNVIMGDYTADDSCDSGIIIFDESQTDADSQLAYLIARQWFGEIVGSDSMTEPWLSEALAQYAALMCAQNASLKCQSAIERDIDASLRITLPGGMTVESDASVFLSNTDYVNVLRYRGAAVLRMLDEVMGDAFTQALKIYITDNAYGITDRSEFVTALNSADGSDWSAWLSETLQGIGKLG